MATTKATTLAHTLGGISSDISTAEINRLDGVTGDLQTQLDAKAPIASPTFTGTANISSGATFPSNPTIELGSNATFPAGTVLQIQSVAGTQQTGSGGAVIKYMEVSLTTKSANSDFFVICNVAYASPGTSANMDPYDHSFAVAYKLASDADSAYVGKLNNSSYQRRPFSGTNIGSQAWYSSDVHWSPNRTDTHSGAYDVFNQSFSGLDQTLSLASGTAIKYALYVDVQDTYYLSQSRVNGGNGGSSNFTVMEIKNV